jgi:methyl-accepting chemotaxis protein
MNLMRRFSIRMRMLGAVLLVGALMAGLGGTGLWSLSRLSALDESFVRGTYGSTVSLTTLRMAIYDLRQLEKNIVIAYEKTDLVAGYQLKWRAALDQARKQAVAVAAAGEADSPRAQGAAKIDQLLGAYAERATPVMRQIQNGAYDTATVADRMLDRAKGTVQEAEAEIDKLLAALAEEAVQSRQARGDAARQIQALFVAAVLLSIGIVLPLTLANQRSICRPLEQAQGMANAIAASDLSTRVDATGIDETAQMLRSLNHMQSSLGTIVGQVRESAESVQVASSEVAAGTADLSHRTEQAAANLQQTASSMEELRSRVHQSADAAAQAHQLASTAFEAAQRGGSVVQQVVMNMEDISQSSRKIADITGLIDTIAFQTNILALNAAVEAARAGEQGRGFAVVAGEVRGLAHHSAEAARQIKKLIEDSVEKVASGARLVNDAGATMQEVLASVQGVTGIIGRITTSAAEQSEQIGQIHGAVSQLDQVTQQNAALVEQSTAAAESLREQAARLTGVVATFRLG